MTIRTHGQGGEGEREDGDECGLGGAGHGYFRCFGGGGASASSRSSCLVVAWRMYAEMDIPKRFATILTRAIHSASALKSSLSRLSAIGSWSTNTVTDVILTGNVTPSEHSILSAGGTYCDRKINVKIPQTGLASENACTYTLPQ